MKAIKIIKALTIINFFALIIAFVSCRTKGVENVKIENEKAPQKTNLELDEEYIEIKEFFMDKMNIKISSSKSSPIVEKKDIIDFDKLLNDLLGFKFVSSSEKKTNNKYPTDKEIEDFHMSSSKSMEIIQPKKEIKKR
jgi:hypothetical protein